MVILREYRPKNCRLWTPLFLLERHGGRLEYPKLKFPPRGSPLTSITSSVSSFGDFATVRYMGYTRGTRGLFLYVGVTQDGPELPPRGSSGRAKRFWEATLDEIVNHRRLLHFDIIPLVTWETISQPWARAGSSCCVVGYRGCCARMLPMMILCKPHGGDVEYETYAAAAKKAIWGADAHKRKGGVVRFLLFYSRAILEGENDQHRGTDSLLMHPSPETRCCKYTYSGRPCVLSFHRLDADHAKNPGDGRRAPWISP